jgi:hypothetical protein
LVMIDISSILSEVTVYSPITYRNLTMFPLGAKAVGELDYLTLDEALRSGLVHIGEMSRAGSVPELRFENSAHLPVLIVDGEELVGAKQNRTANLTVLAPARTKIVLPVSCVEAGRWSHDSGHFVASERAHFARGRASKVASVSQSMSSAGSRRSDQARVWRDIENKAERMKASSPTRAMAAIFERHRTSIQDYVTALAAIDGQAGAVFAIGSEVVGLDLFDRCATLSALLPKLVRSYAVDALEVAEERSSPPAVEKAEAFLRTAASAKVDTYPAVGLGTDIRLSAPGLAGGGLVVDDVLVHLAAFAVADDRSRGRVESRGMASARARRRSVQRR